MLVACSASRPSRERASCAMIDTSRKPPAASTRSTLARSANANAPGAAGSLGAGGVCSSGAATSIGTRIQGFSASDRQQTNASRPDGASCARDRQQRRGDVDAGDAPIRCGACQHARLVARRRSRRRERARRHAAPAMPRRHPRTAAAMRRAPPTTRPNSRRTVRSIARVGSRADAKARPRPWIGLPDLAVAAREAGRSGGLLRDEVARYGTERRAPVVYRTAIRVWVPSPRPTCNLGM